MRCIGLKWILLFGILLQGLGIGVNIVYGVDFGIVVNKTNRVEDLSLRELTKIFKAEKLFWDDGKKVVLILPETALEEKKILLNVIYKTSDEELKKFWLAKIFRNEIPLAPKVLSSTTAIVKFIEKVEGSIGIIKLDGPLEAGLKIVKINGKLPGEPNYELRSEPSN
jgi:hypothetical protein